jgi:hypothetical protein
MSKRIAYHYSGDNSKKFWNTINSLMDKKDKREYWNELYSLGVALQNLEDHVLRRLRSEAPGAVRVSAWNKQRWDEK